MQFADAEYVVITAAAATMVFPVQGTVEDIAVWFINWSRGHAGGTRRWCRSGSPLYTVNVPMAVLYRIMSCWIPSTVPRVYDALAFCPSSLYALGYDNTLQEDSEVVEKSELRHAGYSADGAT